MAEPSPSYSQDNDYVLDFLNLPEPGLSSDSFAFSSVQNTPSLSQAQTVNPEFPPPSHPYDLHQQQTEVIDWTDMSMDPFMQMDEATSSAAPPPTIPALNFWDPLSQPVSSHGMMNMSRQTSSNSRRLQVQPGYHQAQAQQMKMEQPAISAKEQQINRYLDSFVVKPSPAGLKPPSDHLPHIARAKKQEEQMDEDERLLASEAGKKLNSKERRQLRNKVSARAFRSRRKEYITQLETEVHKKTYEAEIANDTARRLQAENDKLRSLTKSLLQHEAFKDLINEMAAPLVEQPVAAPKPAPEMTPTVAPASIQSVAPRTGWPGWERPAMNSPMRPNIY